MEAQVTIRLSEQGQKDALARGLPAERDQVITVPANNGDLKYFNVDSKGQLSLHLTSGAGVTRSWGSWSDLSWDVYPSAEDILNYLRTRDEKRAAIEAAEQAEKERKDADERAKHEAAYQKFCALSEEEQEKLVNVSYKDRVHLDMELLAQDYAAVAAACARVADKNKQKEKLAAVRKKLPAGPRDDLAVTLSADGSDGSYKLTVPEGKYSDKWAKRVSSVDSAQRGGFAIGGSWLDCGSTYNMPAGEIIAVGSKEWQGSRKRGSYVNDYRLFVVTPAMLVPIGAWDGVSKDKTNEQLSLTAEERVEQALKHRIDQAQKYIDRLIALDRTEFAALTGEIDERLTQWREQKAACERALEGAAPDANIVDIDSAASAIVAAGYRELAKKHHPDQGGAAETMALLNAAKKQLVEILSAAREVK